MQNKLNMALTLVSGLAGGMLTHFVTLPTVSAQNQSQVVQEVRARSFVLVDGQNRAIGTFRGEPLPGSITTGPGGTAPPSLNRSGGRIVLRDERGREIWSAGPDARVMPLQSFR